MGILSDKKLLITGVLTDDSLAFAVAKLAIDEGAEIVLTGAGRGLSLTERTARKLPSSVEVLELDVTVPDHGTAVRDRLNDKFGRLDGILHSIGFAPQTCIGEGMFKAEWDDVATMLQISTYSLKSLVQTFLPLLDKSPGASIVSLDFDAGVAWPGYDWMGVAKAGLESLARYLARDLGPRNIRVNLVAAGPIRTIAARSIPGFERFEEAWQSRAPLGWDINAEQEPVAHACVALLSDWFSRTTGEIVHVDGGYHAIGA
jgi:enoyl-[acyl-carrier protein] reductase I